MGDAQHLALGAQRAQFLPDHFGDGAADAGVDLVEDHAADGILAQGGDFDRQADAGQFAAGGDLAQRARRLAGIGADQQLAAFEPLWIRFAAASRLQLDAQEAAGHAQFGHQHADLVAEPGGGRRARAAEPGRRTDVIVLQALALCRQLLQCVTGTFEFDQLGMQGGQPVVQLGHRQPMPT